MIPGSGRSPWRRKQQPTLVFLPGESHGQKSLAGYSPGNCKELDTTEQLALAGAQTVNNLLTMWETQVRSLGQEDRLKKGMATHSSILAWKIPWTEAPGEPGVHGVTKSQTRLSN